MAVVERKRRVGKTYWVATFVPSTGRTHWERSGADKRAAEQLDAKRKREVEAGEFGVAKKATMRLGDFLRAWLKERRTRNRVDDERNVRRYLLGRDWLVRLSLEELRPAHGIRLVQELKATTSEQTGKILSTKYVSNIYGLYTSALGAARISDLITHDPCKLPRGLLRRTARRGTRKPYDLASVRALAVDAPMSEGRAFAALAFYTGEREGEVCGRRWRDINPEAKPLACLDVTTQYDDQPLKTDEHEAGEHARKVPIHPELARTLRGWWETGFEWTYARKPLLDDFIVPRTKDGKPHTKSSGYKLFRAHAKACDVPNLSLHSTRHTFITLARRGGAPEEDVERVTHNARGSVVDEYTHAQWDQLCAAVMAFDKTSEALKTRGLDYADGGASRLALPPGGGSEEPGATSGGEADRHGADPIGTPVGGAAKDTTPAGGPEVAGAYFDPDFDVAQKPAAEEWRRRELNPGIGTVERGKARKNAEESPGRVDRKNTGKTATRCKPLRASMVRDIDPHGPDSSGSRAFRALSWLWLRRAA